ncbi:putative alcohol dehydrogenase protein [Daldinia childiae]|uniref:putative alcohol dehydrogenase protein n=1 Tax=Daldinia childiae TaxID=326645 RepID=UPI001445F73D|nr:putative alcohol dehydrogenase protein [Daldinia childiae]KAF3063476.1 putative alcohol dehydrogenase protein [Daldinia childiae]
MHSAQVQSWTQGPRYVSVDNPPTPSDSQVQLRVLAAGVHQVVRTRASGAHYSARVLPHTLGIDCVGKDESTGKLYYAFTMNGGTFVERINIDKSNVYPLTDLVDPISFAANLNPAMSSWMAITHRTTNLPKDFTAVIIGATSASGRLAVHSAKALGAGKVIGIARNSATLADVDGLDDYIVLQDPVTETNFSKIHNVDVILDYVYGDATVHLLTSLSRVKQPVQYVQIGGLSQQTPQIPSRLLRSFDLTIRGAGAGSWSISALMKELHTMVPTVASWKLTPAWSVQLKDIEETWNDASLKAKGRVVYVP